MYNHIKNIFVLLLFLSFAPQLIRSITKNYRTLIEPRFRVGVIHLSDVISTSLEYTRQLNNFFADETIKAILLTIDSPGSTAGSANNIYNEIKTLKKEFPKPIISLVENMCTSGAYLIASATDHIITPGTGVIGNIGTQFSTPDIHKFLEKYNIEYTSISSGKYKTIGNPFIPLTQDQKEHMQQIQDDIYKQFVDIVAKERKLSLLQVDTWADGKIFTGRQAVQLGLADSNGSLQNAVAILKERAFVDGQIEWVHPEQSLNIFSSLLHKGYQSIASGLISQIACNL